MMVRFFPVTLCAVCLLISHARGAEDASVAAAELRMLRSSNERMAKENAALKTEITALKAEVDALRKQLAAGTAATRPTGTAAKMEVAATATDKKVVLSAQEFKALPVFRRQAQKSSGPIDFSATGTRASDGSPMGFTTTELNAVGYISATKILRILDVTAATVEIDLCDSRTGVSYADNGGRRILRTLILEGQPTRGQVEDNPWRLQSWFKIVDTRKLDDGKSYFVAWPIVQATSANPPARSAPVR